MHWSKAVFGMFLGLLYAVVYFLLAFNAGGGGGAGHGPGTGIFFAAVLPYGMGLLFFPVIGFLAGNLRAFMVKVLFISATVIHYALVVNFLRIDWLRDSARIEGMWMYSPISIVLPGAFYLIGQLVIWLLFIREFVLNSRRASEQALGADSPVSSL